MRHYVIQRRAHAWGGPWEVLAAHRYATLEEAKAAFEALPFRTGCRIAESYTVVRYRAAKL